MAVQDGKLVSFSKEYRAILEKELRLLIERLDAPSIIKESMLYSLEAGGKRIRPMLLFATIKGFDTEVEKGLKVAAAIEMIHTYSLIHDDLPSMDNDDLRRGKPTNHKVYGDAIAILAGDALLTYSFDVICDTADEHVNSGKKIKLIQELAKAAGPEGMVGGQVADMQGEDRQLTLNELEYIHINKTGKLLMYSVVAGAIIAGANQEQLEKLSQFAFHLGLAFQIRDDILDVEGNEQLIGKPIGSDTGNNKSTYPSLLTLEGAKKSLESHIKMAKQFLYEAKINSELLEEITQLVAEREH